MLIRPCLDLTRNAWVKNHGDLTVYGTWYWDADDNQWVPSLVIMRAHARLLIEETMPCIVPVDHAWCWSEEEGGWEHIAPTLLAFCEALKMPDDQKSMFRLVDIVRNHLEDLLKRIPPRPKNFDDEAIVADAVAKVNGKTHHTEISDRV